MTASRLLFGPAAKPSPAMTTGAKLEKLRACANEMAADAAKGEPGWEQLARWSERLNKILDGRFD